MKAGDIINGFKVLSAVKSEELGGTLWKMEHIKTKAGLAWLDNGEENKLFSVTLKTLPRDDTGVFHILEHSVLCGSENFPVKEPFLDLLKGSMNTFLNAMTFPDKTMYPVSSRNEQDFINLTTVYLDAVFCPAIYKNPCIFKQEGWHYELHEGESVPTYKGVVFNEMKGAYSSVEAVVDAEMCKLLFPDSCYRHSSGGDPESIPALSYERFLDAHREFYHPSNSRTYLDGDLPIERVLALIDSYFDKYEYDATAHDIFMQQPTSATEGTAFYEIGKDESEEEKVQLSFGKLLCDFDDRKKILASDILSTYLAASNASPLKKAIIGEGLAQDAWLSINWGMAQTYSVLRIKNTEESKRERIEEAIRTTAEKLLSEGLDREELEATINRMEYNIKVTEEPQGVERAIMAMNGWLYGGEPEDYLMLGDIVAALRAELDGSYFEELLRELLLDGEHTSVLTVLPSKTKGDEARARESERLMRAAESWNDGDRARIARETDELEAWQTSEDTPEALATVPALSRKDISAQPEKTDTEIKEENGVTFIFHKVPSKGTVHARCYFNIGDMPFEKIADIAFISDILGELPTENYSVTELKKQIRKYTGALGFDVYVYECPGDTSKCRVFFGAWMNLLEANLEKTLELVGEILLKTRFDTKSEIKELLVQRTERRYRSIISSGHVYAARRALSSFSAEGELNERISGYDRYRALFELSASFDEKFEEFSAFANAFAKKTFVRERLTVSHTADGECGELAGFVQSLPNGEGKKIPEFMTLIPSNECKKEAIQIPSGVSYAGMATNISSFGGEYSGEMGVLRGLLSFGYLWNEIRVLGGAYGCGFLCGYTGNAAFRTFRDPTPLRSLDIFNDTSRFISDYVNSDEDIDKYIISSISSSEPLCSPEQKGDNGDARFFLGDLYEKRVLRRQQLLSMKKQDLLDFCALFDNIAQNSSRCLIAHDAVISQLDGSWTVYKL